MPPETLKLLEDMRQAAEDVAGFAVGRSLGNGYGQVDHAKTWDILITELPTLRRELADLLK